jgi:hypothetical protein
MIGWLTKRLSPVKRDTPRWQQFAEAVQEFWAELFDPEIEKARNSRSIYTADSDGQLQILRELGGYYENDLPEENLPIACAIRKYEIHQKETNIPFLASMARACPEISVEWVPLYAPTWTRYGVKFYTAYEILPGWLTESPWRLDGTWKVKKKTAVTIGKPCLKVDGTWQVGATPPKKLGYPSVYLTSRGMIAIDWATIKDLKWIDILRQRISQTKPLHIVFDGFLYRAYPLLPVDTRLEHQSTLRAEINLSPSTHLGCANRLDGTWKVGPGNGIKIKGCNLEMEFTFSREN